MKGQLLIVLFAAGSVLFMYPFLAVFNRAEIVLGVPLLYLYLFVTWGVFVAVLVLLVERHQRQSGGTNRE